MAEKKRYQIVITQPALERYRERVLAYLADHFSLERAIEIDDNIMGKAASLSTNPLRGRREEQLAGRPQEFRFILYKETRHFELKIVYYVSEEAASVYVTDFFPTAMHPQRMQGNQ